MKDFFKRWLQKILGFNNYLFWFSVYAIRKSRGDREFIYFMDKIPQDGSAILDIGANIGIMSVNLGRRFPGSKIYSFEPMPNNLIALKRVIKYYNLNNIIVSEIALGEENGNLKIVTPVINNVKMQGLTHVWSAERYPTTNEGIIFDVPVKRLDEVEVLNNASISAIKIDVENFEFEVLKGGRNLLTKHKPIIYCELWPGEQRIRTINFLCELGYQTEVFEGDKFVAYRGQESTNFIFSYPGKP